MEIPEKEVCSFLRISSKGNRHMEAQEKEKIPFCKVGICAHPERPVAEKSSHVELEEEEGSQFSKVAL